MVLSFTKVGLAPATFTVDVTKWLIGLSQFVAMSMQPVAASEKICPIDGGRVADLGSGASVTILPGTSLVCADGSSYQGNVTVSLAVIDAKDPQALEAMPGDFSAVDVSGAPVQLESFGALWVGLCGEKGETLQVSEAASQGLEMELFSEVRVRFERLGAPPTMWEFDAGSGKWKQDATGVLEVDGVVLPQAGVDPYSVRPTPDRGNVVTAVANANAKGKAKAKLGKRDEAHSLNFYDFLEGAPTWTPEAYKTFFGRPVPKRSFKMKDVRRGGYWNCDAAYITTFLCGRVLDAHGAPVLQANVWSVGKDYQGASPRSGVDVDGGFTVLSQCLSKVDVMVLLPGDSEPRRFKFGVFETGPPGESISLGTLRVTADKQFFDLKPEDEEIARNE